MNPNDLIVRLLRTADLRAKVIAGNLANQTTPAYTRREVRFEDALREALERGRDVDRIQPEIRVDTSLPPRPDGNNVSLEIEMSAHRENRILHETFVGMLRGHFSLLETAITGGR